jgi:hypothetical protein
MADLSFSFHWSQASSAIVLAASAVSAVANRSATWDKASAASSAVIVAAGKASDASSAVAARSAAWDAGAAAASKASDASSAIVALDAIVIKSVPGTDSRAVHEIMVAANGEIKYVYSSNAAA